MSIWPNSSWRVSAGILQAYTTERARCQHLAARGHPSEAPGGSAAGAAICATGRYDPVWAGEREPSRADGMVTPKGADSRGGAATLMGAGGDAVGHGWLSPLPRWLPSALRLLRISVS